jgi:hypothetical protein
MRHDPAGLLAAKSTHLLLTASIGIAEMKRKSLGATTEHGDAGDPSEDG